MTKTTILCFSLLILLLSVDSHPFNDKIDTTTNNVDSWEPVYDFDDQSDISIERAFAALFDYQERLYQQSILEFSSVKRKYTSDSLELTINYSTAAEGFVNKWTGYVTVKNNIAVVDRVKFLEAFEYF